MPSPRTSPLVRSALLLAACSALQLACSLGREATAVPAPQSATAEAAPAVDQPTGSSGAAATRTLEPLPEPRSLPEGPLSNAGPWYVFMAYAAEHEVWALNTDGSGLTLIWSIVDEQATESFKLWPAPTGGRIALLQYSTTLQTPPVLRVLQLPSGNELASIDLLPRSIDTSALQGKAREAADQVWAAVGVWNRPAWSPDGRWLAFNAAIDGPSADVYVYDTISDSIERLTDGPAQSVDLAWSPDSAYIVHGVADSLYYRYSGLGYGMLSAWAAPPDPDKQVVRIYDHVFHGYEYILGWLDDGRYLGDWLDGESLGNCGYAGLRTIDIRTGPGASLLAGSYSLRDFDPESGMMVLVLSPALQEFGCTTSLDPGVYLFDISRRQASPVPNVDPEFIQSVTWSKEAGFFFLGGGEELLSIDPAGNVARYPSIEDLYDTPPVVAPGGERWVLANSFQGTMAVGSRDAQIIQIEADSPGDAFWSLDGEWLFFIAGLDVYAAPAPDFSPPVVIREGLLSAGGPALVQP